MNILVFGRGVIGTQYGWALEKAGHTIDFYVRPGRAAEYGSFVDLDIYDMRTSVRGVQVCERWSMRFIEQIPFDHLYDVIILSVPHHRFREAATYLGPRAGSATILVFNNFWEEPLKAAAALPEQQLVWGFPGAGGGFDGKVLRGALLKSVQFGTFNSELTTRERVLRALFQHAGFTITEQADLQGWLWTHFALNAGLHAQALQVGSIAGMMNSVPHGREAVLTCARRSPCSRGGAWTSSDFRRMCRSSGCRLGSAR